MFALCVGLATALSGFAPATQFQIDVRLLKGDPLGSREAGNLKHLSEPRIITQSGRSAEFRSGGFREVKGPDGKTVLEHFGTHVQIVPVGYSHGRVWVEVDASDRRPGQRLGEYGRPTFSTNAIRGACVMKLGETFKMRITADAPDDQLWVEVTVRAAAATK